MNENTIPLSNLLPGQKAVIVRVDGPNGLARRRFLEMGFVKGEKIIVEHVAPLGDPVKYRVKGYHISLRKEDAAKIQVVLLVDGDDA